MIDKFGMEEEMPSFMGDGIAETVVVYTLWCEVS
jgi:hypothetical protein